MTEPATILIADDEPSDVGALTRLFEKLKIRNPLQSVSDGHEAISYLCGEGIYADRKTYPFPALLFLDLVLPRKYGLDVLRWIRRRTELQLETLAIVAMTGMGNVDEIRHAYYSGAHTFLIKPLIDEDFVNLIEGHVGIRTERAADGIVLHFIPACFRRKL
jgi:CheY-like chemotaxis protein